MFIYSKEPRFNSRTGEKYETWVRSGVICDYTGLKLPFSYKEDDYEIRPMYSIAFDYDNDSEEIWYYDEEAIELGREYGFNYFSLHRSPYHFKSVDDFCDVTYELTEEWKKGLDLHDSIFYECRSFEGACRKVRYRTVKRLLKDEKMDIAALGLTEDIE